MKDAAEVEALMAPFRGDLHRGEVDDTPMSAGEVEAWRQDEVLRGDIERRFAETYGRPGTEEEIDQAEAHIFLVEDDIRLARKIRRTAHGASLRAAAERVRKVDEKAAAIRRFVADYRRKNPRAPAGAERKATASKFGLSKSSVGAYFRRLKLS